MLADKGWVLRHNIPRAGTTATDKSIKNIQIGTESSVSLASV